MRPLIVVSPSRRPKGSLGLAHGLIYRGDDNKILLLRSKRKLKNV